MKIQNNSYVAIDYTLTDTAGEVLDQSSPGEPLGFVYGANMIIPGLERELVGMEQGDSKSVVIEPSDGYGEVNDELFQRVPKSAFPPDAELQVGMTFATPTPQGLVPVTVAEVADEDVLIDLNHPLAGTQLHFNVKVTEVRESTPEDLAPACASCGDVEGCGGSC